MRQIELVTRLPASAAEAWAVLIDVDRWPEWGRLVTSARGEFVPGRVWTMRLSGRDGGPPRFMHPRFVAMPRPRGLVFETRFGGAWGVRLVHAFDVECDGPDRSLLRQSFDATGALVPLLWESLHRGMTQFEALGVDLARRLGQPDERGHTGAGPRG